MKILVVSDTHGDVGSLKKALDKQPAAEMVIHLGDGSADFDELYPPVKRTIVRVRGNCDTDSFEQSLRIIEVQGKRIYCTHGHLHGVKYDMLNLQLKAREQNCDIALFGHTHTAFSGYFDGLYMFNPGSLNRGCYGGASYGLVEITDAGIMTNIVRL